MGNLVMKTRMLEKNFDSLSFDELVSMRERIDKALAHRIESERERLELQLEQLKKFQVGEIPSGVVSMRPKRFYPKVTPKYMNPDNGSEVWSGRGLRPKWIVTALKDGKRLEDLEIARQKPRAATSANNRRKRR
jgi:DNA-binding protein H-NS